MLQPYSAGLEPVTLGGQVLLIGGASGVPNEQRRYGARRVRRVGVLLATGRHLLGARGRRAPRHLVASIHGSQGLLCSRQVNLAITTPASVTVADRCPVTDPSPDRNSSS